MIPCTINCLKVAAVSACVALCVAARAGETAPAGDSQPAEATTAPAAIGPFDRALIIPIEGVITDITLRSIQRRLKTVRAEEVPLIIFEMNTPGGALEPTLEICTTIRDLRREGVRCYAWINKQAYSAGTIIALATDGIIMAPDATIGDCQPIMVTGMGVEAIPESIEAKATSPLIAELRTSSRDGGYPLVMVMALIRPEMQVFWLVNGRTGERRFADVRERDQLFGIRTPEQGIERAEDDKDKRRTPAVRIEPVPDSESKTDWRYVKEDPVLGTVHQPIVGDRELLTMRDREARAYGFSKATVSGREELRSALQVTGPIEKMEITYLESVISWLASPLVRSVLFILMLLGAYAEFHTPGLSLGGLVALIALVLFLGAPYLAGYTVTWEIVAILLGIVLIAIELFLLPGFGVAGLVGLMLLGLGLIASFVPPEPVLPDRGRFQWPQMRLTYDYLRQGLYSLAVGLAGGAAGMVVLARYLPKVLVAGQFIAPNPDHDSVQADDPYRGVVDIGDIGKAETLLRPAGKARFGDRLVDVVSLAEYIEPGSAVEVVERHGSRVVVRRVG